MSSLLPDDVQPAQRVLVTGANGFIGRRVVARLMAEGIDVVGAVRSRTGETWEVDSPSLGAQGDWEACLAGRTLVVHTAGRAHVLDERMENPIDAFRAVNRDGSIRLAEQAVQAGVKRFVFLSSIGVNGVQNTRPFTEADIAVPLEPYAISKLEAEQALMSIAGKTGMEVVIVRPPLVYGPDAPGNFGRLVRAVQRGLPLPLGAVRKNRRTLVALDNLVDLILTCMHHPDAANQIFLAGDAEDLSTTDLLQRLADAMDVPVRLLPVPVWLLSMGATLLGRRTMIDRLCGSLQVSIDKARARLGWVPPLTVHEALAQVAASLKSNNSK